MDSSSASTSELSPIIPFGKYIEEDVMIEILIRLPYKSISRFKCVSKLWLSLLSHPTFNSRWLHNLSIPRWLFFYNFQHPLNYMPNNYPNIYSSKDNFIANNAGFSFQFLISKISLLQQDFPECDDDYYKSELKLLSSSNGLICCEISHVLQQKVYIVGNPVTGAWAYILPPPPLGTRGLSVYTTGFVCCESSASNSLKSNYMVVRIPILDKAVIKFDIELFSSDTGSWHVYEVLCPREVTHKTRNPAIASHNEVLYWIVGSDTNDEIILAYDLNKNAGAGSHPCRLIKLPQRATFRYSPGCLGTVEGFISYSHCPKGVLYVWLLEDNCTTGLWKWHLTQNTNLVQDSILFENIEEDCKGLDRNKLLDVAPLAFHPMDQNVIFISSHRSSVRSSQVFMYNFKTKLLTQLRRELTDPRHSPFVLIPSLQTV